MRSVIAYTTARILVFVATLGVLYLLGARDLLLLGLAVLISGLVSLVLLSRQRDAVSSVVATSMASGRRRFEQARTAEDPRPPEGVKVPEDAKSAENAKVPGDAKSAENAKSAESSKAAENVKAPESAGGGA